MNLIKKIINKIIKLLPKDKNFIPPNDVEIASDLLAKFVDNLKSEKNVISKKSEESLVEELKENDRFRSRSFEKACKKIIK